MRRPGKRRPSGPPTGRSAATAYRPTPHASRTKGVRRLAVVFGVTTDYLYQLTHLLRASALGTVP
jgi:hypothetical protein